MNKYCLKLSIAMLGLAIGLIGYTPSIKAQIPPENLVLNPSFEQYTTCPNTPNQLVNNVANWLKVTNTTPDYFNACNSGGFGVPNNSRGSINAYEGVAYAGIVTYWNDNPYGGPYPQWREYLQTSLSLQQGITYDISFRTVLASASGWSTKNLGAHISSSMINTNNENPINLFPTFQYTSQITNTTQWTTLSFQFTPQSSGTFYLIIGDFSVNNSPQATANNGSDGYAYYYIDGVSVTAEGCCPNHLIITDKVYSSSTSSTVAANTITAGPSVTVSNNATVSYIAGSAIELAGGFTVESGADFSAIIGACPAQFQQREIEFFPNVFTPNGDGVNDELCIFSTGGTHYSFQVFNSWGNPIYVGGGPITGIPQCVWGGECNQPFPHCLTSYVGNGAYATIFKLMGCDA